MRGRSQEWSLRRAGTALGLDDPRLAGLLILLWSTTAIYVGLHLSNWFLGVPWSPGFDLGAERGYGEVFFQMLTGWSVVLLTIAAHRLRAGMLLIWAAATAYLLVDDYFVVHERIGTWFATDVLYVGRLSTHVGEALWLCLVGIVILTALVLGYRRARPDVRRIARVVACLYAALAFFGVVVDAAHSPFIDMPIIDPLLIALEDGGEIAVMCALAVFLLGLAFPARSGPTPAVVDVEQWS